MAAANSRAHNTVVAYEHPMAGALFIDIQRRAATHFDDTGPARHGEVDANVHEGTAAVGCNLAEIDEIDLLVRAVGEVLQLKVRLSNEWNRRGFDCSGTDYMLVVHGGVEVCDAAFRQQAVVRDRAGVGTEPGEYCDDKVIDISLGCSVAFDYSTGRRAGAVCGRVAVSFGCFIDVSEQDVRCADCLVRMY